MNENYLKQYVIAELGICMHTPWEETLSHDFEPFVTDEEQNGWQVFFEEKEHLPEQCGEKVFENQVFAVFMDEAGRCQRRFHDARPGDNVYAVMHTDSEKRRVLIEYLSERICHFRSSRKDFFHIGWEKILICEERMILHAACVETSFGGILFSGPSGIGKSTQANLWCEHKQAWLINGDKPVLRKTGSGWKAYGSPYAGSSRCHVNVSCKIKAIVVLKKAESCSVRRLAVLEAFRKIYEQTTVNSWDKAYVAKSCDMVLKLVQEIPVYELSCTPDQAAVEALAGELRKEE